MIFSTLNNNLKLHGINSLSKVYRKLIQKEEIKLKHCNIQIKI